ncbi:unnamed protein product [Brassicogethes aeneus]|uniref:Protein MCM10 homolog n=1 Tax=Brassicogethes aeneus TaxID=1431903 RepID=A0A9P0AVJ9_BRAAE|nr:unnamed protein product [Brassicogethes aeneus]
MAENSLIDEFLAEDDPLDDFLCNASEEFEKKKFVTEVDIFTEKPEENNVSINEESVVRTTQQYFSDEEEDPYNKKYSTKSERTVKPNTSSSWLSKPKNTLELPKIEQNKPAGDVYTDPVFGLRIINPLVSSQVLKERMIGREAIPFLKLKNFVQSQDTNKDWVIGGVLVTKFPVKTSQKGKQYSLWKLSDLKNDIKTITLFLFGSAHSAFWKTTTGTVLGVLNPNVMENKSDSKDEASLNVDNAQKLMVLGQSKDLGACKSLKKNGERCNAVVNVNRCEFCVYHVKQEYQKCTKRSELQANFAGNGLTALRNKVLGKNEVFYGGKSYTSVPANKSRKLEKKDRGILDNLNGMRQNLVGSTSAVKKKGAAMLEVSHSQRLKDLEIIKKIGGAKPSPTSSLENVKSQTVLNIQPIPESKANIPNTPKEKSIPKKDPMVMTIPTLSTSKMINLNEPITPRHILRTKHNAIKYVQRHGTIKKADPNSVKSSGSKRKFEEPKSDDAAETSLTSSSVSKKSKLETNDFISDRFKKMMAQTSKHTDLLEQRDDEEAEKYFHKLEMKEQMEEKMTSTYKVACKAVTCTVCKYTSFSAAEKCKTEKHRLKVSDATKRFFKCGNCSNRVASLEIVPTKLCGSCGAGRWERTGMMKEKTVTHAHSLSIRGGEQKFVGGATTNANLDLMVPE